MVSPFRSLSSSPSLRAAKLVIAFCPRHQGPLTAQGRGEVVKFSKRPIPREFWFWRVVFFLNSRSEKRIYFSLKLKTANLEWDRVCLQHGHPLLQKLCGAKKATNLFFEMQHCNTLALLFLSLRLTSSICRFFFLLQKQFNSIWGHKLWILITFAKVKELKIWEAAVKAGL